MGKHTPGPWVYTNGENPIDIGTYKHSGCYANPCLVGSDGRVVAGCDEYWVLGDQDETGRADCHLLAAAPDLLAACEAALQEFGTIDHAYSLGMLDTNPAVKQLRATIKKARGER